MGAGESHFPLQEGFVKLVEADVGADDPLWASLWTHKQNVFADITPTNVRDLKALRPSNLSILLQKIAAKLKEHAASKFQSPNDTPQLLNALQLLTRVVPFLFENEGSDAVHKLFWDAPAEATPLAVQLLEGVMAVTFLPGFTVADANSLWEPGLGGTETHQTKGTFDKNRAESIRALLILFSKTLFRTPDEYKTLENKWLAHATTADPAWVRKLFASLVNVTFSYDPVGWGVPYAGAFVSDSREALVDLSLQTLIVLLDFEHRPAAGPASAAAAAATNTNQFVSALTEISETKDFALLFQGFSRLLNNPHRSSSTMLPQSVKQISCNQELLIFFWKLVDRNKDFLAFILKTYDINQIVVPMLYFMYDGRKDPSKIGLIHICTFILLLLSGERNFCVALNAPFQTKLPVDLPVFTGNHADLLFITIFKLMTDGPDKLESLYDCFLTVMSNVSPYVKTFCMSSAFRLLQLFEHFSKVKVLKVNDHNHRYVVFFLEIFNNVIQYQYEGNPSLIYQIIQRRHVFEQLASLGGGSAEAAAAAAEPAPAGGAAVPGAVPEPVIQAADMSHAHNAPKSGGEAITMEWLRTWKEKLPLQPSLRLLQHLLPQVEAFCQQSGVTNEALVTEFLRGTTMVGLLPVPHPILIRKYQPNEYTNLWFTTYIWGVIYLRSQSPPLFDANHIKLFTITFVDSA